MRRGQAVAEGMALARISATWGATSATRPISPRRAQALGKEFKFEVEVLERADMEKLGMGSALSVGRASH